VQIPKKFVGIGKEKQPGQYPLELTTEASKAIRLTPTKAATASNGFYEFPAFSDGSQSAKGYLAVQEENVDHPRYREFVFVTDPVQSQTAPGKRFSYQNWKLDDKGSQALEIDLPGEWGIQRHRFVRVDRKYFSSLLMNQVKIANIPQNGKVPVQKLPLPVYGDPSGCS
jgi:hypothetical protein